MGRIGWIGTGIFLATVLAGCGSSSGSGTVRLSAKFIAGANPVARSSAQARPARPATGLWALSPQKVKINFTKVVLVTEAGTSSSVTLSNCLATYERTQTSGVEVLDCPMDVPPGSYTSMQLHFSNDMQVLVSDAANSFYSVNGATPPISLTPPSGSTQGELATFPEIDVNGTAAERSYETIFTEPMVVSSASTPPIYVVTDLNHTIRVNVSGSTLTIPAQNRPMQFFATHTSKGSAHFYSNKASAETQFEGNAAPYEYWVRLFLDSADKPFSVLTEGRGGGMDACVPGSTLYPFQAYSIAPADAAKKQDGTSLGGYLGLSGTTAAWAFPTSLAWSAYTSLYTMDPKSTIGESTTINCQTITSAPAPTDGKTYASGTPALTATFSLALKLLAK